MDGHPGGETARESRVKRGFKLAGRRLLRSNEITKGDGKDPVDSRMGTGVSTELA